MSLASQTNELLRILLDKPISPITYKQIVNLVTKNILSNEVLSNLFLSKNRGDLLIFLLQNSNFTIINIENMLIQIKKNILKYNQTQVRMIWSLVLKKKQYAGLREEWGLFGLLNQSLRRTNQECKEDLLWLISSNFQVLKELGQGKIIESFMKTYCQKYLKQNIYLTPFPFIVLQSIQTSSQVSTEIINLPTKKQILQRTMNLLDSTSNKLCYAFQNQCLNLIESLLECKNLPVDSILLHNCKRVVDNFLWKKPTREAGRGAQQAIYNLQSKFIEEEKGKMVYNVRQEKNQHQTLLLIENIIDRVNQYRQRQRMLNSEIKSKKNIKIQTTSSIQNKSVTPLKRNSYVSKKYPQLQHLIQSCLKEKEENQKQIQNRFNSEQKNQRKSNYENEMINSRHLSESSKVEEFDQFAEVSDLIDLAYQYKFS